MVIFEIMGIRSLDEGVYTCVASNKVGQDETSFNLKYVEGVNKDIPKFTVVNVTCNNGLIYMFI